MKIEWKPIVSLDTIIAAVLVLASVFSAYLNISTRLTTLEVKMDFALAAPKGGGS